MFLRRLCILLFFASLQAFAEDTVLFLGDSLTAGYGVLSEESYPSLLEAEFKKDGRSVKVVNGAESGSLSSSLPTRLEFYLKRFKPKLVVVASGGNDARQLTDVAQIEKNLKLTVEAAKKSGAKVALQSMEIFPNLGKEYVERFKEIYPRIAKQSKVTLLPFMLKDVAGKPELNQKDGFHPNAKGHEVISRFLKPHLEKLL